MAEAIAIGEAALSAKFDCKHPSGHQDACRCRNAQSGLAYLGLIITVAVLGTVSASALQLGAIHGQRSAEEQLLAASQEIHLALQRYADHTPAGLPRSPLSLDELLRDPRYPGIVRHLRQLYVDPFTGAADWGVIRDPSGRIVAIHSRSKLKPLKSTGFDWPLVYLEGKKKTYEEWLIGPQAQALPLSNISNHP